MPSQMPNTAPVVNISAESQVTEQVLPFWTNFVINPNGGLYGRVSVSGEADPSAEQGVLLYSRALWSFSAAAASFADKGYLASAEHIYQALMRGFFDPHNGGVYWSLSANGKPCDTSKKLLGQTYILFALAKYYEVSGDQTALDTAFELNDLIHQHFCRADDTYRGDLSNRFLPNSAAEKNLISTCNQLHTLEALTQLYSISPTETVKQRLETLIDMFVDSIFPSNGHLPLLFDRQWQPLASERSIGHNFEAPWLVVLACMVLGDDERLRRVTGHLTQLVDISLREGCHPSGNILFGLDENSQPADFIPWWPQTEALNALFALHRLTGEARYLIELNKVWSNILSYWADPVNGEWFSELDLNLEPIAGQIKAGEWRSCYHIIRACLVTAGGFESIANIKQQGVTPGFGADLLHHG